MKSKFVQLSVALKLVVICFFLLALSSFWRFGIDIQTKRVLDIGPLLGGIVEWGLAIGLINRSNESRTWAVFIAFLSSLVSFFGLAIAVFEDPNSTKGFHLQIQTPMTHVTHAQEIAFVGAFLILNVAVLFTLMRPSTKAFFTSQTNLKDKQ